MKKNIFFIAFIFPLVLSAQEKPLLKTDFSSDTVGMNGSLEIVFTLENAAIKKLNPPNFEGFDVQGPSTMTSMSIVNGVTTQSMSYTYYLTPKKTGVFNFDAASAETSLGVVNSDKKTLVVLDNYAIPKKNNRSRFGFFDDEAPGFFNVRPSQPKSAPPKKSQTTKSKYSTEDI